MPVVFGLFRNSNDNAAHVAAIVNAGEILNAGIPFHTRMGQELTKLTNLTRASSYDLPTAVYSRLRTIDVTLSKLLTHIERNDASMEQKVFLESMLTDYIPKVITTYVNLSPDDKGDNTPAGLLLARQCGTLEEKARELAHMVRTGAFAELSIHADFLDDRFSNS